jgi:hypothetical protein
MPRKRRNWFGPSRTEVWRQLSDEIGGTFTSGGAWKRDTVEVSHGEWTLTLDKYVVSTGKTTTTYTRMRAPYVNLGEFRFTIYRRSVFSRLGTRLGMQDIEVGFPQFDEDFVIKGTDEARVRRLFRNARLRELIAAQPAIRLSVRDDEGWFGRTFPDGVDQLEFLVVGVITDIERLKGIFDLFAETLDELCRMGAAYKRAPTMPA